VKWEERIGGAETGDEVVFECPNSALCAITAMDAGGGKLEGDVGFVEERFEGS
jgi:hypothetical protein